MQNLVLHQLRFQGKSRGLAVAGKPGFCGAQYGGISSRAHKKPRLFQCSISPNHTISNHWYAIKELQHSLTPCTEMIFSPCHPKTLDFRLTQLSSNNIFQKEDQQKSYSTNVSINNLSPFILLRR